MTPKIAIVIVSWNVCSHTLGCVAALVGESVEKEIVVVDNASSDGTVEVLQKEFPEIKIIANKTNRGFAAAVNQGVVTTSVPIIFILNPDTKVQPDALKIMVTQFEQHPETAIIGAHLVHETGKIVASVRANPTWWSQILILLKVHRLVPGLLANYLQRGFDYTKEQTVDQVMGSAMAFRREAFNALGGFDEKFFIWFEEVDFCKRARDAGCNIVYSPDIIVTDFAGRSFVQVDAKTKARYFTNSLNYYARKHWSGVGQTCIRVAGWLHRLMAHGVQVAKIKPQPRPR